jgi:hypothetical protein
MNIQKKDALDWFIKNEHTREELLYHLEKRGIIKSVVGEFSPVIVSFIVTAILVLLVIYLYNQIPIF